MSTTEILAADIEDLEALLAKAKRPKVRAILTDYLHQLRAEKDSLKPGNAAHGVAAPASARSMPVSAPAPAPAPTPARAPAPDPAPAPAPAKPATAPAAPPPAPVKLPTRVPEGGPSVTYTTIPSFGWDQDSYSADPNFVYVYITSGVDGVGDIKERVTCDFTARSFDLKIGDLKGKHLRLFKNNLDKDIDPAQSKVIVKKSQIKIKMRKVKGQYGYDQWVDLVSKRPREEDGKDKDPGAALMDMMKEMYDSGDDQLKKTLGEAMLKSRQKEAAGGDTGLDDY